MTLPYCDCAVWQHFENETGKMKQEKTDDGIIF